MNAKFCEIAGAIFPSDDAAKVISFVATADYDMLKICKETFPDDVFLMTLINASGMSDTRVIECVLTKRACEMYK